MSISSIMNTGVTALNANQSALRVTSSNVANVNTPGYVRREAQMSALSYAGQGAGVEAIVSRAADRFLAAAHTRAISDVGRYGASADLMDRAQSAFGDPSSGNSVFGALDDVTLKIGALSADPNASLQQRDFISSVDRLLGDVQQTYNDIDGLRDEADRKIDDAVSRANGLLTQLASLNGDIQRAQASGLDASGAETQQSQLLDELAGIIDFTANPRSQGGLEIRTGSGLILVDTEAARIASADTAQGSRFGGLNIFPPGSSGAIDLTTQIRSGELRGLLTTRDVDLPNLGYALSEFAAGLATALNTAHNDGSAVPAPSLLQGRNTGLLATDALNFTGRSVVSVTDPDGLTVRAVEIDFNAGTMTSNGVTTGFAPTVGGLTTALNTALGPSGTATFQAGKLTLSATGGNGIATGTPDTGGASRAGRGFADTFGLNDLVRSFAPLSYDTGLAAGDPHGFTAGEQISFGIRNTNGDLIQTIGFTVSGTSMADLVTSLNTPAALGSYATASLDANGRLSIVPKPGSSIGTVDVVTDRTQRGDTGLSLSAIFGLGTSTPAERARNLQVDGQILRDTSLVSTARLDVSALTPGARGLSPGDNTGALKLQTAFETPFQRRSPNGVIGPRLTLTEAAGQLAGDAGLAAKSLETRAISALAVRDEAALRRSSVEGVNLDEEMVNMTVYQQSYSAASRLITAARDMYDTLLNMV